MAVAFSPDGKLLATGGAAGKDGKGGSAVILWDTNTWEPKKELPAEPGWVSSVAFSPGDGKTLAVGTNQIKLWLVRDLLSGDK